MSDTFQKRFVIITTNMRSYIELARLDKPIGIYLLLWPTLIALVVASNGIPDFKYLLIFILGVIVMRSAGCVANDLADTKFDGFVARTKARPLVSGKITKKQAVFFLLALLGFALLLVLQLNFYSIILSFVALLLALCYPLMKRFMGYPQIILGASFSMAIIMAFAAVNNHVSIYAFLLFFSNVCWTIAFDTQYAMADLTDDLKIGVKSTAISFGNKVKEIILGLHILALLGVAYVGYMKEFSVLFYFFITVALCLVMYQQILIKNADATLCHKAFLNNNYIGLTLFIAVLIEYTRLPCY